MLFYAIRNSKVLSLQDTCIFLLLISGDLNILGSISTPYLIAAQ